MNLFPFQEKARDYLIERRCALLAYDMGLGKTFISLAAAEKLKLPTLIVCPAFMKNTWKKAIELFPGIPEYDICTWSNVKMSFCMALIADESHYAKNPEAARTKAFLKLAESVRERNGFVWLLSGTPAKNTAAELFCQFEAIGLSGYSYADFAEEFSSPYLVKYGQMTKPVKKYKGVRNVEKLRALYEPFMQVLKARDVLDLPMQIKKEIMCDFSVFSLEDLQEFRGDAEKFIKKNFSTKKRQQANMNVSTTKSLVEDLKNTFDKIIVFSDHVDSAKTLANEFSCGLITGEVPIAKRDEIIDEFASRGQVLCCTIGAAGVGLNLQFCSAMVFSDLSWSAADMLQAEKRIHRINQTQRCYYYYVIDCGLGEMIHHTLQEKIKMLEQIK